MSKSIKLFLLFTLIAMSLSSGFAQNEVEGIAQRKSIPPPYLSIEDNWIDQHMSEMSLREKIGQLFMVAAYSNKGKRHTEQLKKQIEDYNIGGLIFFQGAPHAQAKFTNQLQSISNIPLLIAQDAEWGLSMRLDSVIGLPKQLALGAVRNNELIFDYGRIVGEQCKRIGVHINLAPVVDVNNNIENPVINDRSFGENIYNVANKSIAYMKGMQDKGIIACAKHFPGHGDTDSDSHKTLPTISHDRSRLDSIELYPFKKLIDNGIGSIMSAHLYVPNLDSNKYASSLSKKINHDLLKEELGFKGLTITDALNMKGVTKYFKSGELEVRALLADNDILLFSENVPKAIRAIENAVEGDIITEEMIEEKVRLILKVKLWVGLDKYKPIVLPNITADLNNHKTELLKKKIAEYSITLAKNDDQFLPITKLHNYSFASIAIGQENGTPFQKELENYIHIDHYSVKDKSHPDTYVYLLDQLKTKDIVFVSVHNLGRYKSNDYNLSLNTLGFLKKLQSHTRVVLVLFGSPYSLRYFHDATHAIIGYNNDYYNQITAAQAIFGGNKFLGKLPITASKHFSYASGQVHTQQKRFQFTSPESIGLKPDAFKQVDSIAYEAINEKSTPGCQVLVAHQGKVVYNKAFGHHTYEKDRAVKTTDIYDIASITKIAASTLSIMKLYDMGYIDIEDSLSKHIPETRGTNKANLQIKDILVHQAGLKPWIPFYVKAMNDSFPQFSEQQSDSFGTEVAKGFFMKSSYVDSVWQFILESDVKQNPRYLYSDIGFYFMQRIIERVSDRSLDEFVNEHYYKPLGARRLTYRPIESFSLKKIIPTENDKVFRKQLVHGSVHDPGAAMLGGVGGHAGLFANTGDLAILMQLLLNNGKYGGTKFLEDSTVQLFVNKFKKDNRRGLGFDKPDFDTENGPTSLKCSPLTFGHTGFTGTCMWADPQYDLIYVFLSNRVNPSANYNKLARTNIRTRIQDEIYKVMNTIPNKK